MTVRPGRFTLQERHCAGGWECPGVGLDISTHRKSLYCRWSNPGLSSPKQSQSRCILMCPQLLNYEDPSKYNIKWLIILSHVLLKDKEQRNILHEIRKRKANWIGHILRRNCLLQRVIEGKIKGGIEVTGRRGRRRRKLLDDLKERRGYCHLKEEALDRTMWRTRFLRRLWTCGKTDC